MLVGPLVALAPQIVGAQRVAQRKPGAPLSCLRAGDYLDLPRQGIQALPLLGATADLLVLLAHGLALITTPFCRDGFSLECRFGMAGQVAEQDIVVLLNLVLESDDVLAQVPLNPVKRPSEIAAY